MSAAPFLSSSWYRVARRRPKLRDHTSVHRHRYRGNIWYVVHDHATGRVHRLSPAGYMIVAAMDGARTVDQLWREAGTRLEEEAPSQDEVIQLLAQLNAADLLQTEVTPDSAPLVERAARAGQSRWLGNVLYPLTLRIPLWHPDKFLESSRSFAIWLFGWPGALLWLLAVLPAMLLAAQHWQELSASASDRILAADNILLLALTYLVLKALHEFGHGFAVKAFGGAVHEFGVMFLVFAPVPYVDASAASEFRSKWRRALVGAAGMIVEVFFAALSLFVWLAVEPGLVRAIAFDAMVVAGVSTVVFNGNPLLRYDGYYILSDLLEIPNLAQRGNALLGLSGRSIRVPHRRIEGFRGDRRRAHLASPLCAGVLHLSPGGDAYDRDLHRFGVSRCRRRDRDLEPVYGRRAAYRQGAVAGAREPALPRATAPARSPRPSALSWPCRSLMFLIPAPLYTTTEGVVWLPESAVVRAGTAGFVRALLVEPGKVVTTGEALVESEEVTLKAELEILRARVAELEARLATERFTDRVKAEITTTEIGHARAELANAASRAERLVARSRGEGTFAVMKPQDLPGRFLREGQEIGYVLPAGSRIVRATVRQDDIDLVRHRLRSTSVKLAERLDETLPARIIREVPAGRDDLPSKALGGPGGGALSVDPGDPHGTKTLQRVFQVDIELPSDVAPAAAFGSRAYVRFDHEWEPAGRQIWRRLRQLLLSRLQV